MVPRAYHNSEAQPEQEGPGPSTHASLDTSTRPYKRKAAVGVFLLLLLKAIMYQRYGVCIVPEMQHAGT